VDAILSAPAPPRAGTAPSSTGSLWADQRKEAIQRRSKGATLQELADSYTAAYPPCVAQRRLYQVAISPEEVQKYFAFIEEQAKFLKALDVNNQEVLWHYTTGDALISIIMSGALYATQVSCLNDSTEIQYGVKLLRDAFLDVKADDTDESYLLDRIIKATREAQALPTNLPSVWFVTCFSKEKDDLSQWRAYSGGENGYAIAFLAAGLFGRANGIVARVNYSQDEQREVAMRVARATLEFFKEGLHARATGEIDDASKEAWAIEFLPFWEALIGRLAPMVKDPAFRGENEYRIIHELQNTEFSLLQFRQKQSLMSRHLPLVYPPQNHATPSHLLPIAEIMVGPSRHKEISRISVDTLLRQRGYTIPVTISAIPFQMT
jgi:hypothetical protein